MAHDNDLDKARDSRRNRPGPDEQTYPTYGAFISRKTFTTAHAPTGNNVDQQLPSLIYGTEAEGVIPSILTFSNKTYATNISDTGLNTGAPCICRHVQNRWVTTNHSTKGAISLPGCPCTYIPTTLAMTVTGPSTRRFQNATLVWTHPYAGLESLNLDGTTDGSGYCFLSTAQFPDEYTLTLQDYFYYFFKCGLGIYTLGRVWVRSVLSSGGTDDPGPFRQDNIYTWLPPPLFGNSCSPFAMNNGTAWETYINVVKVAG